MLSSYRVHISCQILPTLHSHAKGKVLGRMKGFYKAAKDFKEKHGKSLNPSILVQFGWFIGSIAGLRKESNRKKGSSNPIFKTLWMTKTKKKTFIG